MTETTIASFIVRFIQEGGADDAAQPAGWRGVVRHVQSNQQMRFTCIEDALHFMEKFVDLNAGGGDAAS